MCKSGRSELRCGVMMKNKFRDPVPIHYSSDNDRTSQVAKTYTKALETINARKATANLHRLYINFAKFYEGGVLAQAEPDLDSAYDNDAVRIMQRATALAKKLQN